jgi:hypothetical protein
VLILSYGLAASRNTRDVKDLQIEDMVNTVMVLGSALRSSKRVPIRFIHARDNFMCFASCVVIYSYYFHIHAPCILILSKFFHSPTDARLNCLKNNFEIYIKIDIDDGDYTETCRNSFSVNFNVHLKKMFLRQFTVHQLGNRKTLLLE